jgi:outer membrane autotransporter protein
MDGGGFAMGIDRLISPDILAGIAGGAGWFSFSVPDRITSGEVDAWHIAAYGAIRQEHFYALGSLAFDHFDNTENRHAFIPGSGLDQNLAGEFPSASVSGYLEAGYKNRIDKFEVTPFAGLQFGSLGIAGFSETQQPGAGNTIGLSYPGHIATSLPTQLGVQLKTETKLAHGKVLSAFVRTSWQHEFDNTRSIQSSFIAANGFDFTIQGARPPVDSARTGAGVNLSVNRDCSLFVNFDADNSGTGHSYAGTGGLKFSF